MTEEFGLEFLWVKRKAHSLKGVLLGTGGGARLPAPKGWRSEESGSGVQSGSPGKRRRKRNCSGPAARGYRVVLASLFLFE